MISARLFQIFSEDDNQSLCIAKVFSGLTYLGFHMYVIWMVLHGTVPTLSEYANSSLQVLAGCGILIATKQVTQKVQPPQQ
jgi:hypothetical protein